MTALLSVAADQLTSWIVPEHVTDFQCATSQIIVVATGVVCTIGARQLTRRADLLPADASWWHARHIKRLCGLFARAMFGASLRIFEGVKPWVVPRVRPEAAGWSFPLWLILLVLVYKARPALLMWLLPPRPESRPVAGAVTGQRDARGVQAGDASR